jgi:hypothetical protein
MKSEYKSCYNNSSEVLYVSRILFELSPTPGLHFETKAVPPGYATFVHGDRDVEWLITREAPTEDDRKALLAAFALSSDYTTLSETLALLVAYTLSRT